MPVLQYVAILSSLVEDYHNTVCSALQCGVMSHPVQCNIHCGRVVGGLLEKLELHVAHMHWWSDVQCSPTPFQCNTCATLCTWTHALVRCVQCFTTYFCYIIRFALVVRCVQCSSLHCNICTALCTGTVLHSVRSPLHCTSYHIHSAHAVHTNKHLHSAISIWATLCCCNICVTLCTTLQFIFVLLCTTTIYELKGALCSNMQKPDALERAPLLLLKLIPANTFSLSLYLKHKPS